jgi:hypothetical protein
MTAYANNLRKNDPVIDANTKRPGKVAADVRETSRTVLVQFQGESSPRRTDVMDLRLVVDGRPEEIPPINGVPPPRAGAARSRNDALESLKADRAAVDAEMRIIEGQFKDRRERRDRLDQAIKIMSPA